MIKKLESELRTHSAICDMLFEERVSTQKHADKWMDDLFRQYQRSETRIKLLVELLMEQND